MVEAYLLSRFFYLIGGEVIKTTEGRNDDWSTKWRLKGEMTTEGRNDAWRAKWRLKDEITTEGRWRVRFPIQTDEWRIVFRTREKSALSDWLSAFSISLGMKIYFAPLRCVNLSGYIGVIVNNRPKWAETHYLVLCWLRFLIFFIFTTWGQKRTSSENASRGKNKQQ